MLQGIQSPRTLYYITLHYITLFIDVASPLYFATCTIYTRYEHEAIRLPKTENNIGAKNKSNGKMTCHFLTSSCSILVFASTALTSAKVAGQYMYVLLDMHCSGSLLQSLA